MGRQTLNSLVGGNSTKWEVYPAKESFAQFSQEWERINRSLYDHILLDSGFVSALIDSFASSRTLLAVARDSNKPALVLIERGAKGFWHTFQPSQSPLGLILLPSTSPPLRHLDGLLQSLPGLPFGVSVLQQDPEFSPLAGISETNRIETIRYIETAQLQLKGTFEDYLMKFGDGIESTHNLNKRCRRLKKNGVTSELHSERNPSKIEEWVREHGFPESMGWKGKEGTNINAENDQGKFYAKVLHGFAARGEAVAYQLRFNGEVAASQLALCRNGMMVFLKTAYDEKFKEYSPGFLMQIEIVKQLFSEQQIHRVEFYGRVRNWHAKWTDSVRSIFHLNLYRYPVLKSLRRLLKQWHEGSALVSPGSEMADKASGIV